MGGEGSGRRPNPIKALHTEESFIPQDDIYIPNLSGVKEEAKKTSPVNIAGGGIISESDPIWGAQSGAVIENTAAIVETSGAVATNTTNISANTSAIVEISGSVASNTSAVVEVSGSLATNTAAIVEVSGSVTSLTSGLSDVSGSLTDLSGAFVNLSGAHYALSGAYSSHVTDSSDPHGSAMTQTHFSGSYISGSTIMTTDQIGAISGAVVGVAFGTSATPPTASSTPLGTIYVQYTA